MPSIFKFSVFYKENFWRTVIWKTDTKVFSLLYNHEEKNILIFCPIEPLTIGELLVKELLLKGEETTMKERLTKSWFSFFF